MILDSLTNISRYKFISANFANAVDYIQTHDLSKLDDGRIVVDGEKLFCNVSSDKTVPVTEKQWEAHHKYIDIQCILVGKETLGCAPLQLMTPLDDYDAEKDVTFYKDSESGYTMLPLASGMFAAFFPWDAHKPQCINESSMRVKKVVLKVLTD